MLAIKIQPWAFDMVVPLLGTLFPISVSKLPFFLTKLLKNYLLCEMLLESPKQNKAFTYIYSTFCT